MSAALPSRVRVACVQYAQRRVSGYDEFAALVAEQVRIAGGYDADFVLFPEMFSLQLLSAQPECLPSAAALDALDEFAPRLNELFATLASTHRICVIGGSHLHRDARGRARNRSVFAHRDGRLELRTKLHATPDERESWGVVGGDAVEAIDTDCGRIGILTGYDSEFPELAREMVDQGAEVLFVPFLTDRPSGYWRVRHCCAARAIENQCFVVMAGSVGVLPGVASVDLHWSQSAALAPCDTGFPANGVLAEASPNVETMLITDLDMKALTRLRDGRGEVQNLIDRRPELYRSKG